MPGDTAKMPPLDVSVAQRSAVRDLQRVIEAHLKDCTFFEAEIVVRKQACNRAYSGTRTCSDSGTLAAALRSSGGSTDAGAHSHCFDFVFLAHALALQFALLTGFLHGVISGNAGNGGD